CLLFLETGRLFVFGSNDWGQLGLGHKNHISKPSCVKALKPEKVTHVACGRAHTLICTGSQKIFACGSDQEGQLGRGVSAIGDSTSTPVLVYDSGLAGSKIVQITAGSHHSLALTSDGGVFAWGSNLEGQLGLPDVSGLVNKPTKVHIPEPVKQISAGYYHSTFLTENGSLYCTGSNSTGQLGLGTNLTDLHTPKLLPRGALRNERIARVSCGESHTAVVTESGKLYTCGDGRHGKLGLEENENNVHELTFVQRYKELFVSNVILRYYLFLVAIFCKSLVIILLQLSKVACGGCHTILVGQRRETNNRSQREENSQVEHIQKRNPLPPLKLSRRQSDVRDEHVGETTRRKNSAESVTSAQETMETSLERKIEENNRDRSVVADSTNDIEKSDDPKNSPELEEESSNEQETDETAPAGANEPEESVKQDGNWERKIEEEASSTKVREEEKSESTNDEKDNEGNKDETSAEANSAGNNEETNKGGDDISENKDEADSNKDVKESTQGSDNGGDAERETSPKNGTPPSDSTPPPKPPRLKSGSESSSIERASSMEKEADVDEKRRMENEEKTEDISVKKSEATDEDEESGRKKESGSMKSATKSGSTKSARSRVAEEEAIEIDKQNDKDRVETDEEKVNSDNAQDDADVVQSPAPRTGKQDDVIKNYVNLTLCARLFLRRGGCI
ncbi:hypothetical protein E2986_13001, partial [Frieseomelitta varia]